MAVRVAAERRGLRLLAEQAERAELAEPAVPAEPAERVDQVALAGREAAQERAGRRRAAQEARLWCTAVTLPTAERAKPVRPMARAIQETAASTAVCLVTTAGQTGVATETPEPVMWTPTAPPETFASRACKAVAFALTLRINASTLHSAGSGSVVRMASVYCPAYPTPIVEMVSSVTLRWGYAPFRRPRVRSRMIAGRLTSYVSAVRVSLAA